MNLNLQFSENNSHILCGFENDPIAESVAKELNIPLMIVKSGIFNDTSSNVKIDVQSSSKFSLENKTLHLIAGNGRPVEGSINDATMQIYLAVDAAKQAGANVKLYIPHLGYARQDRVSQAGEPLAAQAVLKMFQYAGVEKITVLDIHNPDVFQSLQAKRVNKFATSLFVQRFKEMQEAGVDLGELVVVAPDKGARERANVFQSAMKAEGISNVAFAYFDKSRNMAEKGVVQTMDLREYHTPDGDILENEAAAAAFKGKTVVVVDDMADTCGTMLKAISGNIVGRYGAKEVYAVVTHGVFSGDALEKIAKTKELTKMLVTDSLPLRGEAPSNLEVVGCAPVFAEAIQANMKK